MKYKNLVKSILFLSLMGIVLFRVISILEGKWEDGSYVMRMFYEQPEDSVDVLILGSSHAGVDINPAVLWDEYGMASYVLWGSVQPFWNTYYYLLESLQYQEPELIVLEVYRAAETLEYMDPSRIAKNTFGMKASGNKVAAIQASTSPEMYVDYLLQFPIWHTRYNEITQEDFTVYEDAAENGCTYKGLYDKIGLKTTEFTSLPDVSGIDGVGAMTEKSYEYLMKIIEVAEEERIPLFFIVSPYVGITENDKKIYNQVEQIARQNDILFVDFNERMTEIGLEAKTDFAETSHLNQLGQEKYTAYLGKMIKAQY